MTRSTMLALLVLGCGAESAPPEQTAREPVVEPATDPPEIAHPYDEGADAQAQVDAAVARAHADGKRILLMFGANWCVWCRRLSWVFENEPSVRAALAEGWHVVHVDTGTRGSPTNAALVQRYGNPLQHGLPCLVVLDGAGELVHTQETGSLESGDRHDPARVLAFLSRFRHGDED